MRIIPTGLFFIVFLSLLSCSTPENADSNSSNLSTEKESEVIHSESSDDDEEADEGSEFTVQPELLLLTLGDGKYSSSPKEGYIFSCNTRFHGGAAFKDGPWIENEVWNPTEKVIVDGEVVWQNAEITITLTDDDRIIKSNDLPTDETTGIFPIAKTDDAYLYDRNPNNIEEQIIEISLSRGPAIAQEPSCVGQGAIGIMLNGVLLFNGFDAAGRDAVAREIQDSCDGHPQETGQYHYHSQSSCLRDETENGAHSHLLGYALDGFGIYGKYGKEGILYTEDLDECHGHLHEIIWDGETKEMYHYHFTVDFPYSVSCFKGTPVME